MTRGEWFGLGFWRCLTLLSGAVFLSVSILHDAEGQERGFATERLLDGDSLLTEGEVELAGRAYDEVLQRDPDNTDALTGKARVELAEGDRPAAHDLLDRVLKQAPGDTAAHYYKAIVFREQARFRTLLQRLQWEGAEKHFEWVLQRDSSFKDVLYQYALMRRYHDGYPEALRLAHAQIRKRPDLDTPKLGLFRIYKAYVNHLGLEKARRDLQSSDAPYGRFAYADVLRRSGEWTAADTLYTRLVEEGNLPVQPLLLGRARAHYALGEPAEAQRFVERAIEAVDSKLGADFLFEDIKYVMTDEELEAYRRLDTPAAYRQYFRAFWTSRDPMPASTVNERLAQHYRRLDVAERDYAYYGVRFWVNNPDKLGQLDFPDVYDLNDEFNDKGLIYIRHGEPDDRVFNVDAASPPNESWRYYAPQMDFHFIIDEGASGNNWRLAPTLETWTMLESREIWGGIYARALRAHTELEALGYQFEIAENSRNSVALGTATDRVRWPEEIEPLEFDYAIASFRAPEGHVVTEVHYAIPEDLPGKAEDRERIEMEMGGAIHDTSWKEVASDLDTLSFFEDSLGVMRAGFFRFTVQPDTVHVAVHARAVDDSHLAGGYKLDYRIADLYASGLNMSDLLPARTILAQDGPDSFMRDGLYVLPHPSAEFNTSEPVFVYFELYDLQPDAQGETHYRLEYTLTPVGEGRKILGLFGGRSRRPVLTLSTEQSGTEASPVQHAEIDVQKVDPGAYTLTVRATDLESGRTAERSMPVEITR